MTNRYNMDMTWLRNSITHPATLRLTVRGENARTAVQTWFADIPADGLGARGRGGWLIKEVISEPDKVQVDITSGGEDVADGIRDASDEAYEVLDPLGLDLEWEQLPRQ